MFLNLRKSILLNKVMYSLFFKQFKNILFALFLTLKLIIIIPSDTSTFPYPHHWAKGETCDNRTFVLTLIISNTMTTHQ